MPMTVFRHLFICLALAALAQISGPARAAEITLDPDTTFQTINGWEATADMVDTPHTPPWVRYREEMLDRLVSEVGINRVRLEIRAGAESSTGIVSDFISGKLPYKRWKSRRYETANDNGDPFSINWRGFDFAELDWHIENGVLPLMRRLQARGERLIVNLCYVAFRDGRYYHMEPEEYAELVLATYIHMRDTYGFVPDMWEVILEPDLSKNSWNGTDIGRAMAATAKRLRANGFSPAFVAPSVTDMRNALPYLDAIVAVPGAKEHMVEFSYHRYRGGGQKVLRDIDARGRELGIRTAMLEWWFGKATYKVLHNDLKNGEVSAWQGRVIEGHYDVENRDSAHPNLTLRPEIRYNLQYFRYIRHGARRIGATSDDPRNFDPLAFINTNGKYTVVVKAEKAGPVVLHGLPPGRYKLSYAVGSGSKELPDPAVVGPGAPLATEIPGVGVLTIAGF